MSVLSAFMRGVTRLNDFVGRWIALLIFAMFAFLLLRDNARLGLPRVLPKPLTDGTLETTARGLLMNLSLLFVPAGVGVVGRLDLLRAQGAKLALVLVVSTALSLLVTVLVFRAVAALVERRGTDGES